MKLVFHDGKLPFFIPFANVEQPLQNQVMSTRYPLLNYVDLNALAHDLRSKMTGARIDRVFIPQLPEHPNGYFKQEWCLDFYDASHSGQFFFSLRPQACTAFLLPAKSLKPASDATRSGFDLSLVKQIQGSRVADVLAIPNERILQINFGLEKDQKILLLYLIPAQPKAQLLLPDDPKSELPTRRVLPEELKNKFSLTDAYGPDLVHYPELYLNARAASALEIRKSRLEKALKERIDYWNKKSESYKEHLSHQEEELTWSKFGTLLQSQLHSNPTLVSGHYTLTDYETGNPVKVPGDPKFNLKQQMEHYFRQAKRVRTRTEEAKSRLLTADEKTKLYSELLLKLHKNLFSEVESELGISKVKTPLHKAAAQFSGKQFTSIEGLQIFVGRNATENLELTFKVAKGNDIWMHVKGRPGAHVAITLPPKKTASLETLLDAAHLCIHYSGGKDWGKTEVDYTYRKFVKKIKNQTEVTYSANKTLMITPDAVRLKRLLG